MKTRSYEMRARQEAKTATHEAIIAAAVTAIMAERSFAITLRTVAERAGVTVKTVQRHFATREALIDAAITSAYPEVIAEREAPQGDPQAALTVLVEHYEQRGDVVLGVLAEEDDDPRARRMCDTGRISHRGWIERVFGDDLPDQPSSRSRLVDALVVATDVYSWKLLRRDRGLSADEVVDRMLLMTGALTATVDPGARA
jgi:AcrR family transcriptional regulator